MRTVYYLIISVILTLLFGYFVILLISAEKIQIRQIPSDYIDILRVEVSNETFLAPICGKYEETSSFDFCQVHLVSGLRLLVLKASIGEVEHRTDDRRMDIMQGEVLQRANFIPFLYNSGEIKMLRALPKSISKLIINDFNGNCSIFPSHGIQNLYKVKGDFQLCYNDSKAVGIDVSLPSQYDDDSYLLFLKKRQLTYLVLISKYGKYDGQLTPEVIRRTFIETQKCIKQKAPDL